MRIAFVHEYLNQFGGAERMLQVMSAMFPEAPIYTLIYDADLTGHVFDGRTVKTSFLQKLPLTKNHHRLFPLLMPLAIEQFDFSEYDVVVSISASFAKGIITKPSTRHICYCLTPPRFLWDESQKLVDEFNFTKPIKTLIPLFISYLRIWDREASSRPDAYWSISNFIKERVKKYYDQDSTIIYPPVNVKKFRFPNPQIPTSSYFLMVGRLVPYKKFDVAINAFNELGLPLKIAGSGPEIKQLRRKSAKNIEFLGLVPDDKLSELYFNSRALIFPQEEDFGIVPLEAMASGKPVIAYKSGGTLETIVDGVTGLFFDDQNKDSLIKTVKSFDANQFDPLACRRRAESFDVEVFKKRFKSELLAPNKEQVASSK